jgi:DNA anti-recombination protein RmuC
MYIHSKINQKNYDILFTEFSNEVTRLNSQFEKLQGSIEADESNPNPEDMQIEN